MCIYLYMVLGQYAHGAGGCRTAVNCKVGVPVGGRRATRHEIREIEAKVVLTMGTKLAACLIILSRHYRII